MAQRSITALLPVPGCTWAWMLLKPDPKGAGVWPLMSTHQEPRRSSADLRLYGRLGAYEQQARNDMREVSSAGRNAAFDRFLNEVDPHGELAPEERFRRAKAAQKAWMLRIALLSVKARQGKR